MKRYIHSSTITDNGFFLEIGKQAIFLRSSGSNITDKILRKFVNAICDIKGISDSTRQKALYDKPTLDDLRRRIVKASLEEIDNPTVHYFSIKGKYFTLNFPEQEFEDEVIVIE